MQLENRQPTSKSRNSSCPVSCHGGEFTISQCAFPKESLLKIMCNSYFSLFELPMLLLLFSRKNDSQGSKYQSSWKLSYCMEYGPIRSYLWFWWWSDNIINGTNQFMISHLWDHICRFLGSMDIVQLVVKVSKTLSRYPNHSETIYLRCPNDNYDELDKWKWNAYTG